MKQHLSAVLWSQMLALILLALLLYPQVGFIRKIIWAVLAAIFIFIVPGYRISQLFFNKDELSIFERFVTSLALSLGIIVFLAFYLHYFGIAVYPIHIYILSCIIILVSWICLAFRKNKKA